MKKHENPARAARLCRRQRLPGALCRMRRHADILAEYNGYKRAVVYQLIGFALCLGLQLALDASAWPVVLAVGAMSLGIMALAFWKLRNLKYPVRCLQQHAAAVPGERP